MRAKVVAECTLKESAAINQILGRRVCYFPNKSIDYSFFLFIRFQSYLIHIKKEKKK